MSNNNVLKTGYWPHIDGLRAIAVLVVLLFHFKASGFKAGYLGVDIFFVISGFLVTRLILKDIDEHGKMRFGRFFARRVRRLFPTLAAVCVCTTIAAYIWMDADKLAAFGKSVAGAIFSLSNILFWSESGYFDAGSETKPLLHTWSLSVEEQFYLIWPATLAFGYKLFQSRALKVLSVGAFLLSIGLILFWRIGEFDVRKDSTVFFWMPFRIFEFMLGAICLLVYDRFSRLSPGASLVLCGLGIALMLGSVIFPSYNGYEDGLVLGLTACLGAVLVILTPANLISQHVLSWSPVRWVGQISYSLYLVHWPLWIFAPLWLKDGGLNWIWLTLLSIAITLPLHYLIETPLRHGKLSRIFRMKPSGDLYLFALIAAFIAASGLYISKQENLPFRPSVQISAENHKDGMRKRFSNLTCLMSRLEKDKTCDFSKPVQILFFGNSHEADGFNAFYPMFKDNPDINFINFETVNGCKIQLVNGQIATDVTARSCMKRVGNLNRLLAEKRITHVVFTANVPFAANKQTLWNALEIIQNSNPDIQFVVMGGFLNTKEDCTTLINRYGNMRACLKPKYTKFFPKNEETTGAVKGTVPYVYIDRAALMCPDGTPQSCEPSYKGVPVFYDPHHMSLEYAERVGIRMIETYEAELEKIGLSRRARR